MYNLLFFVAFIAISVAIAYLFRRIESLRKEQALSSPQPEAPSKPQPEAPSKPQPKSTEWPSEKEVLNNKDYWPKEDNDGEKVTFGKRNGNYLLVKYGVRFKKCTKCNRWLPVARFHKDTTWSGYHSSCIECNSTDNPTGEETPAYSIEQVLSHPDLWPKNEQDGKVIRFEHSKIIHLVKHGVEFKKCAICLNWHPVALFSKCKKSKDGLYSYCSDCRSHYQHEYDIKSGRYTKDPLLLSPSIFS